MTVNDLAALHKSIDAALCAQRGSLRRLRPGKLDADTTAHVERLKAESEPFRRSVRNRDEHDRVHAEIRNEKVIERQQAAGVARFHAHATRQRTAEARAVITKQKENTALSFPNVLGDVSGDGKVTLALLQVHTATALSSMDAGRLLDVYKAALARQDVLGYVQALNVESMVGAAPYHADGQQDLASAKQLRELIADVQALRIPALLPDFDALDAEVSRLDARADLLGVLATNPDRDQQAADAFTQQQADLLEAGAASDTEDEQARRAAGRQAS